ncbi:MAG TPA: site-specific integrase [Methylophilaceae bacterium]|jgi:integrase
MSKHHPNNERIKHKYFEFLKEAMRQSEPTIDGVAKALARFETYTNNRDFRLFHHQQAVGFKKYLTEQKSQQKDAKLSKSTLHTSFTHLKRFFEWLAREPGYKSRIQYSDAEYFNASGKDMQVATARRTQKAPTLEQIRHVINFMPINTEIEQRNRALIAFAILTGARDSAIASVKLKHINLDDNSFFQDAREVRTKFSKTFPTFFFPVGEDISQILTDWIHYLRTEKLWGNDDPLFPMTNIAIGPSKHFEANGLKREHWRTASSIRVIFRDAFTRANLPYFNPHSFRNTLVQLGQTKCKTPEAFKAWSQNLGHESVLTTFSSYGEVSGQRQAELLKNQANSFHEEQAINTALADAIAQRIIERGGAIVSI